MSEIAEVVSLKDMAVVGTPRWYALNQVEALMTEDEQLSVKEAIIAVVESETVAYLRGSNDKVQFAAVIDVAVAFGVPQQECNDAVTRASEREMNAQYGDGRAES